jgi:NAD(P) transhydrogenase subunit alpha
MEAAASSDGYAKEMTAEQEAATAAMYDEEARAADIVITTALIPGRPAPQLVSAETVAAMRPGSVIVDMAAANGGNVAATVKDERVVTANGVTVLGYTDLAGRLAAQTSQLYGTNIVNLLTLLTPGKDGVLTLDMDDVVQRGIAVTRAADGGAEVMWPPPPVQVSAAPAAPAAAPEPTPEKAPPDPRRRLYAAGLAAVVFLALATLAPASFLPSLTVFVLAVVIGFYVIGNVHHALHTPLMSVTNAISGIIVVGAILQAPVDNVAVQVIAGVAILLASINVFGGFLVTRRMLNMFQKG